MAQEGLAEGGEAHAVGGGSAADLKKTMADDTRRWGPVVPKSGFKAD